VDAQGLHGLVCRLAPRKIVRHQAVIDTIPCAITSPGIPISNEPVGLTRLNSKWFDG